MARPPRILISAGEASGDRLGAGLARALLQRRPELELHGMGGPRMEAEGVRLIRHSSEVAVVGFAEVLAHLPAIRRAMATLAEFLERERPALLVPIDFPDFNLRLAAKARRAGVEVVYFVSPQIWAWRRGRVRMIRRLVRRMLVLFPFETGFYESAGVPVTFVGHPAADHAAPARSARELRAAAGFDADAEIVALVPGSRRGEVGRLLPRILEAALLVRERHPATRFLLPVAPGLDREWVAGLVARGALRDVRLHQGDFPEILGACRAGVVASGTASLEAAVAGMPMVVVYRMSAVSYLIARALVGLEQIALPNLVAGRRVVPELVQGDCTPPRIAAELLRYLDEPAERERVRAELTRIRAELGGAGVFERAADAILAELPPRGAGPDAAM